MASPPLTQPIGSAGIAGMGKRPGTSSVFGSGGDDTVDDNGDDSCCANDVAYTTI
jgi:hypothetical protein